MSSQIRSSSTTAPRADSKVLKFVSRAEQLRLRGQRNYGRWKMLTKGFVKADGPERAAWDEESAQESLRDSEWNRRHGPVPGGASVLPWRHEPAGTRQERRQNAHAQPLAERSRSHGDGD